MSEPTEWFRALLDTAPEVFFRYQIDPERRVSYVSPSIEALTGRGQAEFYADADLCLGVVANGDRRLLRRVLAARRGVELTLHVVRDGVRLPVELRTVSIIRRRRLVAIEGVCRLIVGGRAAHTGPALREGEADEPVQQRLAALMVEVHALLHRVVPSTTAEESAGNRGVLRLGAIVIDRDRLTVSDAGRPVPLTPREVMVLRYLLERPGRIVTRQQLLQDVWDYHYTGDDRTVDVHISRLRRKLPSLRNHLTALRGIGYRVDADVRSALHATGS
jgi:DNA-binding winged helix-turn-helix (wHTH) protein